MALLVTGDYTTPQGIPVPAVYWRWVGLAVDVPTGEAGVTLHGYVSEEAYNSKAHPIATQHVTLSGQQFAEMAVAIETPGNPGLSAIVYSHVKTLEGFAAAVDV